MFSRPKLIVLLVICETIACQTDNSVSNASRFRRRSLPQNVSNSSNKQTNISAEDEIIRKIFTVRESGLVLFNSSTKDKAIGEMQSDQASKENQEFKVQRNQDGKLNIVFNDAFFSQNPTPSRSSANLAKKATPSESKDIYFPDEFDLIPKCKSQGKSFCTEVQDYPEIELENILKKQPSKFDLLFGNDDIPFPLNISQRISPGEDSLCTSVERLIYPKAGESMNSKWLYIVNQQNYTQAVKIEECINPDAPCAFAETFPNRYVTKCKQMYMQRHLVAITKSGEVVVDVFKLPSCCKCIYKQV